MSVIEILILLISLALPVGCLTTVIRDVCADRYRGVSDIEQKTADLQNHKRESCHNLCHIGMGTLCLSCYDFKQCRKDCKEQIKADIDRWLKEKKAKGKK